MGNKSPVTTAIKIRAFTVDKNIGYTLLQTTLEDLFLHYKIPVVLGNRQFEVHVIKVFKDRRFKSGYREETFVVL